jgi:hypothetical protein
MVKRDAVEHTQETPTGHHESVALWCIGQSRAGGVSSMKFVQLAHCTQH